jgi:Ca-activated chloride channel family protein
MKRRLGLCGLMALACAPVLWGDAGVLVPAGSQQPDPAVFSLDEMKIDILVDNGTARVDVRQIYGSHGSDITEAAYYFALPPAASVSDFAVWDGVVRIPGVILERRRAGEVYNQAKSQIIDPGLLQMGDERTDVTSLTTFSARIMPFPAFGTKRMEIQYYEPVAVENRQSEFAVPLRPDAYQSQVAGHLFIRFELHSAYPLKSFNVTSRAYPLKIVEQTPGTVRATFEGAHVKFTEDLTVHYSVDAAAAGSVRVLAHRDGDGPGFFKASVLLPESRVTASQPRRPRTIIALFDNSLSMQWEKLERTWQACEALLSSLSPPDSFNLLLFNSDLRAFAPAPLPATRENVQKALGFVKAGDIRGGTNVQAALKAGLEQPSAGEPFLVLLSDGGATEGAIQNGRLAAWYSAERNKLPVERRPHTFAFTVGDDANFPLMRLLAQNDGLAEWVRYSEAIDFKLKTFLSRIGQQPVKELALDGPAAASLIYPLQRSSFGGSLASWIGQYPKPVPSATFTIHGTENGERLQFTTSAKLPAREADHAELPRTWARARVDALLEKIEREGEDQATIDEIIRLSREYKFVTPYTSFLAVPRALLRPRVIRPGDPVLRVHTDASIVSVVALFPFGLIKPLRELADEDVWQTRFLAPPDMNDGAYPVRLILRDRDGHVYRESKSFVIASTPPVVRARADKPHYRGGEIIQLRATSTGMARTITASLYGAIPASLHWNPAVAANTGELIVPEGLPPGRYAVRVTAEDIAHNIGTAEVPIEIW